VKKFSQEVTQDSQVTASRGAIGCWFLIKSSTLTAQQLVDLFKQAIAARRPITVDQLSALVVHVEPNFLLHISPPINDQPFKKTTPTTLRRVGFQPEDPPVPSPPDDHLYQVNALWGLRNHDHPGVDIHAAEAWQQGTGSDRIVVGVIDSGIFYCHPDLSLNVWRAPQDFEVTLGEEVIHCPQGSHGYNLVDGPAEVCNPLDKPENFGHGTHIAGIVGAVGNNNEGAVGVNWTTKLIGLKAADVFGKVTVSDAVKAIAFAIKVRERFGADANIRVLNASFGYLAEPGDPELDPTNLRSAIEEAGLPQNDMLFVASAGEDSGNNNDLRPHYPSSFSDLPNLISVTAIDEEGKLAGFGANYGLTSVHLGAPGVNIYSTYPFDPETYYYSKSGTSMSAPFVSGAAALMLSVPKCSTLHASDLKQLILQGKDGTDLAGKTVTGGRLNVYRSIGLCGP